MADKKLQIHKKLKTEQHNVCSMCIKINKVSKQEAGI